MPARNCTIIRDRDLNVYMLGSKGLAPAIGPGLAMTQQRYVVVIDGDGGLLMNPNILILQCSHHPTCS